MWSWRQSQVLAVLERLQELPAADADSTGDIFVEARHVTPDEAVRILDYLIRQTPESRQHIYDLIHSADPRNRSLALTMVVELPPMPDPRLELTWRAIRTLEAARKIVYRAYRPFPDDPLNSDYRKVRDDLKALINKLSGLETEVRKVSFDARRKGTEKVQ
jgi:hypothetical protein